MDEMTCVIDTDPAALGEPLGAPIAPPLEWFLEPPEGFQFTRMNHVDFCGEIGRYASVVLEDGVPFSFEYPDLSIPSIEGASSYYFNHRMERPLAVQGPNGLEEIAAGAIGFQHSPDHLDDLESIYHYHDRDLAPGFGGAVMERALIRSRLVQVDDFILAVGAVVPTLTMGEALAIYHAEISGEMMVLRDENGRERLAIEGASLVLAGNTRTSASSNEKVQRARIRKATSKMINGTSTTFTIPKAGRDDSPPVLKMSTETEAELRAKIRAEVEAELAAEADAKAAEDKVAEDAARLEAVEAAVASLQGDVGAVVEHLMHEQSAADA